MRVRSIAISSRSTAGRRFRLGCTAALPLALAACNLTPHYTRPDVPPPQTWHTAAEPEKAAADQNMTWPSTDWWQGFASKQLNDYIGKAQRANDDIAAAVARVQEADAQARIAGAALLPTLDLTADATRQREPVSGQGLKTSSAYSPLLNASFELDFWGKNRAARDAAIATATASKYDKVTVELTVMTSVATSYFQALGLRDRLVVAQDNLSNAQTVLKALKLEQQVGVATALDVAQQETTVATLDAAVPPLRQQLRQTLDALAILVGQQPETVDITSGTLADLSEPQVRPGLPSELLQRRPDVAEAEQQLISANANIGVARASFFPSIGLTANGGYASSQLSGLLTPVNKVFSVTAGLTQPIFEGGALRGQYDYSKARYTELLADYHKAVISAFGNVEDALVALQQTAEQQRLQEEATAKARRAFELSRTQMRAGTVNILTVLNTETALFTAQDALVQVRLAHLQALLNLFNALGGGWQLA